MRRALTIALFLLASMFVLFATTFVDSNGNALTAEELHGTYSSSTVQDGELSWTLEISGYGDLIFVLREGGEDRRLSDMKTVASQYTLNIKYKGVDITSYTGRVGLNGSTYNALRFAGDIQLVAAFEELEFEISGNGCTYRLGTIDLLGVWDVLYPGIPGSIGYVFYDKGYYSDGWRYLEAAPADLKVIDGIPTVDENAEGYDTAQDEFVFGYFRQSADGPNLFVNGLGVYDFFSCTDKDLETGIRNTELLVNAMGQEAYVNATGDEKSSLYAAKLCADLVYVDSEGVVHDDWFLPSRDELNQMYSLLKDKNLGNFPETYYDYYWTSSEYISLPENMWYQYFSDGDTYDGSRDGYCRVRPVRAF